jgi:Zn-dependent peptidase ImmA (M78 family)
MAIIPEVAKDILRRHWNFTVPVDLDGMAARAGFEVTYSYDTSMVCSGSCEVVDGRGLITINGNESRVRQRFTLAHELAHLFLGHANGGKKFRDDPKIFTNPYAESMQEVDANRLGAALLMPADAIEHFIVKRGMTSVQDLAKTFEVSRVAMEIRLKELRWMR